jgi:hypothetical protein
MLDLFATLLQLLLADFTKFRRHAIALWARYYQINVVIGNQVQVSNELIYPIRC